MSIWKKAKLWTKIKDTFALGGTAVSAMLVVGNKLQIITTPDYTELISIGVTFTGVLIGMWFEDKDGDGNVDLFQDEIKTNI